MPFRDTAAGPSRGMCLDAHDLVCAELVAGREKDFAFAAALIDADLVSCSVLLERAAALDAIQGVRSRVLAWVESVARRRATAQQRRPGSS